MYIYNIQHTSKITHCISSLFDLIRHSMQHIQKLSMFKVWQTIDKNDYSCLTTVNNKTWQIKLQLRWQDAPS